MGESVEIKIEKIGGLGDGVGHLAARTVFVPYTLPGDSVRARIVKRSREADFAELEAILIPGPGRVAPFCKHFADCGGCALQHLDDSHYIDFKSTTAREAVRKAGFDPAITAPLVRVSTASRRRVELKIEEGRIGYYAERSHRLVAIEECRVLEPGLEALVLRLKPYLAGWETVSSIQFNGVDEGYDLLLNATEFKPWALPKDNALIRISARVGSETRIVVQNRPATVTLAGHRIEVPPGAFLQASREAQTLMTDFVLRSAAGRKHILDLFAGVGTYSVPLAAVAPVTAVEGDAAMAQALATAGKTYGLPLEARPRDLFRNPLTAYELQKFDMVVLNPPRLGAKEQTAALAASNVGRIILVSCNPATFARDARTLREAGYRLQEALPVDQFAYSAHLEILAVFDN